MAHDEISRIFRAEYGRTVATLIRYFGSIDLAEDAVQEAFEVAIARWPEDGIPPNPGAWITTTARNRGIDKLRRDRRRDELSREAGAFAEPQQEPEDVGPVRDDRLRLIFTCCHPALSQEAQVALTLRLLGGLTTPEIAGAYLVSESTMAARITRAKKKIAAAGIPYRIPATTIYRTGCRRCCPCSISSTTRDTRRPQVPGLPARIFPRRRSGFQGCWQI